MSKTTRDGVRITSILSAAESIDGVTIREGTKHAYMLNYNGMRPCPVATSTDAKRMIVPWLKQILGTTLGYNNNQVYEGLRRGTYQ